MWSAVNVIKVVFPHCEVSLISCFLRINILLPEFYCSEDMTTTAASNFMPDTCICWSCVRCGTPTMTCCSSQTRACLFINRLCAYLCIGAGVTLGMAQFQLVGL